MNIAITGSHGFIGSALCQALAARGDVATRLGRGEVNASNLEGVDAVVNLAGANILGGLWTQRRKALIRDSRVQTTWRLSQTLASMKNPPRVLISASAVGLYGDRGDEKIDEHAPPGSGFLSRVCVEWEEATTPAAKRGVRVVHPRFGMVLGEDGGALKRILPLFKLGFGGKLGHGRQWMSWVYQDDAIAAILFAIDHDVLSGPVNVVAPNPVTNAEFTKALGALVHRPTFFTVPAFAFNLLGSMGREMFLASTRALPRRLQAAGYTFQCPTLASCFGRKISICSSGRLAKEGDMAEKEIGSVEHFFGHLGVAAIKIKGPLKVGDVIHVKGHTTDFTETVKSIQLKHESIQAAKKGADIGIKMDGKCREHDKVFVVTPD
ncbi:MAG: TIGR01777 family protein [Deltaproteobacteria bacterium]|nr:TIGR01777 family protein [Deltaproteobacteria bacterium]